MKKTLLTLLSMMILAIGTLSAQDSKAFTPSGNFYGYGFGDYYYMAHSDSLGRGAGNLQYKPYSTTSGLNVNIPTGVTSVTTLTGTPPTSATTTSTLTNTKTNLLGSGSNNNTDANGFQIRRFYLGYDYNFAPNFTASTVLADEQNLDAGGNNTVYLKTALVKWANILPKSKNLLNVIIGQQPTASFATPFGTEPLWGYRSVEKTIMDIHSNDSSTDLGVSLTGDLWHGMSGDSLKPNLIGYVLQLGNGNSAKPENDHYKTLRGNLYTSLLKQKLTVGVYGDYRNLAIGAVNQSAHTFKGYATYNTSKFKIGAEVFSQIYVNGAKLSTGTYQNANVFGWSVFLSGKLLPKVNYYAMVDRYNPDTKYDKNSTYSSVPSLITPQYTTTGSVYTLGASKFSQAAVFSTQNMLVTGLDFTPVNRFHIMPNIWVTQFNSRVNLPDAAKNAKRDYDIVPRVTFYYIFNGLKKVGNNGLDI